MRTFIASLVALVLALTPATAQSAETTFKREELQQLLAPVALYPDTLLAQVLMASTYPLQVVQAARWQAENAKLTGSAMDKALAAKEWDPSVKSLVAVPSVLKMMSDKLEWTQKLGDAFLAQQADVMNEVQYLRLKAQEAGNLKSNKQQTVKKSGSVIVIEPASAQVVYVPVYSTTIVYGSWWYPAYPPYYFAPPPGASFVSGFFWGSAVAISASYWGWGRCDWHRTNIDIDVDRYNRINVNRTQINSNTWRHEPKNRGAVPYRDARTREQFASKPHAPATREARGFDAGTSGNGASQRPAGANKQRDLSRPADKANRPTAFEGGKSQAVRAGSERGHASRQSMREGRGAERRDVGGGRSRGGLR